MKEDQWFRDYVGVVLAETQEVLAVVEPQDIDLLLEKIRNADRVFVAGRGRTGLQMQSFAMRLMHLGKSVHVLGDVTTPAVAQGDLLIIGSASGQTDSLVALACKAAGMGIEIAAISSQAQNPISELAAVNLVLPAPTPKNKKHTDTLPSVQPVGGLFESSLVVLLNTLVMILMDRMGVSEMDMMGRHANLE